MPENKKASTVCLSNNLLHRSFEENIPITPMKLQKLLYLVCREYVRACGAYPIIENFCVWKTGPVLVSVYDQFGDTGRPITAYARSAYGNPQMVNEARNPLLRQTLEMIWSNYKFMSANELRHLTSLTNSAWDVAYREGREYLTEEDIRNEVA